MLYDGRMDQHRYIDTLVHYLMPAKDIFFGEEPDWMYHKATSVTEWFNMYIYIIFSL